MTQHKHAEILIAIAEGKDVEFKDESTWATPNYLDKFNPLRRPDLEWRIKPEVKPDAVMCGMAFLGTTSIWFENNGAQTNLKLTFDGETNRLKSAEVIK